MTQPMRLSLIISADAKGVAPATGETRRELRGVAEAAQQTAQVLTFVSAANDRYEVSARRAADAARGQSAAERDLRDSVNRFAGARSPLNDNAIRERSADIDAYGAAMDRMRARFSPLFAVIQNYKAVQAEIRQAHAVGAIGVDEMTAALGRERQAALASIAALKGRSSAVGNAGMGAFNTTNIAAQVQDIGVTTAMGMSPLQIALQQGTQLSAVFEEMRGRGQNLGSALFAAFTSVLSPVSLVTIGVIAGAAALAQYVMSASSVKSVDDILADHERNIALLGPAYEKAAKGARHYATMSAEAVEAAMKGDKEAAQKKVAELTSGVYGQISKAMIKEAAAVGEAAGLIPSRFQAFRELIQLLGAGGLKIIEFNERVAAMERVDPRLGPVATELRALAKDATQAAFDLAGVTDTVDRVALAFGQMQAEIDKINPHNAAGRLADVEKKASELFTRARTGQIDVSGLTEELRSLAAVNPDLSQIIAQIGALGEAALDARAKIGGSTPKGDRLRSMDTLGASFDDVMEFQRRINPDLFDKIDPDKLKKTPRGRASKADPYRDLIKSADDRMKQLKVEIDLTGRAGAEAEALRYEQELLSQATDRGRSIDEEQIAQIKAKAEEYGKLKAQLAATRVEQDLMFERDQLFRSPIDQRIASTMRSAGLEIDLSSTIADQIRWNEEIATTRELIMDIGSGIMDDLSNALDDGKITWEELGDMALNVLGKISASLADLALEMATNAILSSLFGGLTNSGAGFNPSPTGFMDMLGLAKGGVLGGGNVIPFAKGGAFTNSIIDRPTLFSFANGSKFGEMGEAGPEAVMPLRRDAAGRLGVLAAGNDNGGGGGGMHISVGVSVDQNGNLQAYVKSVAQSEGTRAAVSVVRENNQARENMYQNGGRG